MCSNGSRFSSLMGYSIEKMRLTFATKESGLFGRRDRIGRAGIDSRSSQVYNTAKINSCLRGGVQVPTGGDLASGQKARERKLIWCDSRADGIVRMEEEERVIASLCPAVKNCGIFSLEKEAKEAAEKRF